MFNRNYFEKILESNPYIINLYMKNDEELQILGEAIESGKCLRLNTLNLSCNGSYNEITCKGVETLCKAIESGKCVNLTKFSLSSHVYYEAVKDICIALCKAIESGKCANLTTVNLSSNGMRCEEVEALCKVIESGNCPNLTILNLSNNVIDCKGVKALGKAIESDNCPNLTTLDLSCNKIGDEGVKALGKAIKSGKCLNLATLNVAGNRIGSEGLKSLWKATIESGNCPNFTTLDLCSNKIDDEGVKSLSKMIKNKTEVIKDINDLYGNKLKLYLSCNKIGYVGMKFLGQVVSRSYYPSMKIYICGEQEFDMSYLDKLILKRFTNIGMWIGLFLGPCIAYFAGVAALTTFSIAITVFVQSIICGAVAGGLAGKLVGLLNILCFRHGLMGDFFRNDLDNIISTLLR